MEARIFCSDILGSLSSPQQRGGAWQHAAAGSGPLKGLSRIFYPSQRWESRPQLGYSPANRCAHLSPRAGTAASCNPVDGYELRLIRIAPFWVRIRAYHRGRRTACLYGSIFTEERESPTYPDRRSGPHTGRRTSQGGSGPNSRPRCPSGTDTAYNTTNRTAPQHSCCGESLHGWRWHHTPAMRQTFPSFRSGEPIDPTNPAPPHPVKTRSSHHRVPGRVPTHRRSQPPTENHPSNHV